MGEVLQIREKQTAAIYRPDLYGAQLFIDGIHDPSEIRGYIRTQEMTHIAEGIELRQCAPRYMECREDGRVIGFGDQDIEEMAVLGHREAVGRMMRGDEAAVPLVRRRLLDIQIAQRAKRLAAEGRDGDSFFVATPYAEEMDDETASRVMGHWPKYRRSFIWLYRKAGDRLECTDITIDQSQVSTYRELLAEFGVALPDDIESHDVAGYMVDLPNIPDDTTRAACARALRQEYYRLRTGHPESDAKNEEQEALEFLRTQAYHHLTLLVEVHEAIGRSQDSLDPLVEASARTALATLTCLSPRERSQLSHLLSGKISESGRQDAFTTVVRAQRFGIWNAMARILKGEMPVAAPSAPYMNQTVKYGGVSGQQLEMIAFLYANTNQAARKRWVMPGCMGGVSFLGQDKDSIKEGIFGSDEDDESARIPDYIRCIKCHEESPKHVVVKKDSWCCPKCKYEIDICTGLELHKSVVTMSSEAKPRVGLSAAAALLRLPASRAKIQIPEAA